MYIVNVHVHVMPEHREEFIEVILDNARNTVQEPGNLRFDVLQHADDPNRFVLYEVYQDEAALAAHKATAHYARFSASANPWMAETRKGVRFVPLFPEKPEQFRMQI
jgi:(4S)-4-hydroxy-5-phosphonooxypentane-2,3-dione isomerase